MAPIQRNFPLASAGFRILAASTAPSAAPAPTSVWISSITTITDWSFCISSTILFKRSSNSPLYFVPAKIDPKSNANITLPTKNLGILLVKISWAKPSATAVLPTPGSPTRTGLFLVLLAKTAITSLISFSRPTTGSKLPFTASCVIFSANSSNVGVVLPPVPRSIKNRSASVRGFKISSWASSIKIKMKLFKRVISIFNFLSVRRAIPSVSTKSANKICSVPTKLCAKFFPSWTAISKTRLARGVNGISEATKPVPRPI